jgi:HlyD family secretion protein
MAGSKRVAVLLVGILLVWTGLCQIGAQAPLAGSPRVDSLGGDEPFWRAEVQPRSEAEEIYSQVGQPMTILFVAPPGKAVKKGDLLVELDASPLVDKKMQQLLDAQKAASELILAKDSLEMDKRAATGQIELAEKALRLVQGQLKAFTEGEYPLQLAEAQAEASLARERCALAEERFNQLRAESQQATMEIREAHLAFLEASAQSRAAENRLAFLQKSVHDYKVAELELTVAQREFDLARAKDALSSATLRGKQAVSLAEMTCKTESHRLVRLDDQIGKSKIYASRDGTVVYPNDADEAATKPGATVYDRQVLLRLLPVTPAKP